MRKIVFIVSIFIIAFFLRIYHLGFHDFWYDEIYSIQYAKFPWGNLNAPLYWIALHCWTKIFGFSEFALRFPSLLFSYLSVILIFLLGRQLFGRNTGIVASIFMGLSPFHLWYAQEARDYSMALFFGLLSSYLLFKAYKENRLALWALFIASSTAGLYTNYFYIILLFAQTAYLTAVFLKKRKQGLKAIFCFLAAVSAFSLYLPRFLDKFKVVWHGFWIPKPNWHSLIITIENFILGYNGTPSLYIISDVLVAIFFVWAVVAAYKRKQSAAFVFCAFLFCIPLISVFLFSMAFFSIYLDRGLIIFSPYFYLCLSFGLVSLNRKIKTVLSACFLALMFIGAYNYFTDALPAPFEHHVGAYVKKPIRPVAAFLEENLQPQDIVAFANESTAPSLGYYMKADIFCYYYFFDPRFPDTDWNRPRQESEYQIPIHKISLLDAKRIWLLASDWPRSGRLDENSQSVKAWCDRRLKLEESREFDGLWVFRYAM